MKSIRTRNLAPALFTIMTVGALTSCQTVVEKVSPDPGDPEAPESYRRSTPTTVEMVSPEKWWTVFNDKQLNELISRVEGANPDVAAARARVDQAMAALGITQSALIPTITGDSSYTSRRDSLNNLIFPIDTFEYDQYRLGVSSSWEIDFWGRLRAATKRDKLTAEAAKQRYQSALLSMQAQVARSYFNLLYLEAEAGILKDATGIRQEALDLQNARVNRGAAPELDATRARTELETTRTDLDGLDRTRGKLEHSIAVLVGKAPSELDVEPGRIPGRPPRIPAGVPSDLLMRRPDVQAAWMDLEAASQQVGVTFGEFLPKLRLTGSGGVASLSASNVFASESSFFSVGPELDIPLFQGGRRKSSVAQARAQFDEALAQWRSTLLTAVREVDDSLHDIQVLDRQVVSAQKAADAAGETVRLSRLQYDRGLVSYLEVVEAERTRLQADRTVNTLRGERVAATIQLIQALGGSWESKGVPGVK